MLSFIVKWGTQKKTVSFNILFNTDAGLEFTWLVAIVSSQILSYSDKVRKETRKIKQTTFYKVSLDMLASSYICVILILC